MRTVFITHRFSNNIEEATVIRETAKTIWYRVKDSIVKDSKVEQRASKESAWLVFHDTKRKAALYVLSLKEREIRSCKQAIERHEKELLLLKKQHEDALAEEEENAQ